MLTDKNHRSFIILILFSGKLVGENEEIRLFSDNISKSVCIYEPCTVIQSQEKNTTKYSVPINRRGYY